MPNYPDPAALIVGWAKAALGTDNVCTELPTNYVQVLATGPLFVIERFGGGDRLIGLDVAHLSVDTYATSRSAALADAERLRLALRRHQGRTINGIALSRVATISAPTRRPFDSRQVVLVTASYQLHLHAPL